MDEFFKDWDEFEASGASVKFYKKEEDGVKFIGFDSSACVPPEPMVNAMVGLNFIKDKSTKVVMINHKFPAGLIPKISDKFNYKDEILKSGLVRVEFSLKDGVSVDEPLDTAQVCHG